VTADKVCRSAYQVLGVIQDGATMTPSMGQQGLFWLNALIGQWSLMSLTISYTSREVFPLTAGRGGPSDTLTIGVGGDFDTARPQTIDNVGLEVSAAPTPFEISRSIYTNDAYASIVQKELTSTYFSGLYYNETYADGLGSINLWPVPSDDTTSLVLYLPKQLREFASLSDDYTLPPGCLAPLTYGLAQLLAVPFGAPWTGQMDALYNALLANFQRANTVMVDLGLDPMLTEPSGVYNILSDSISGFRGR
jgi:hypothetical protein